MVTKKDVRESMEKRYERIKIDRKSKTKLVVEVTFGYTITPDDIRKHFEELEKTFPDEIIQEIFNMLEDDENWTNLPQIEGTEVGEIILQSAINDGYLSLNQGNISDVDF